MVLLGGSAIATCGGVTAMTDINTAVTDLMIAMLGLMIVTTFAMTVEMCISIDPISDIRLTPVTLL
jgi:hypothetical protein